MDAIYTRNLGCTYKALRMFILCSMCRVHVVHARARAHVRVHAYDKHFNAPASHSRLLKQTNTFSWNAKYGATVTAAP